MKRLAASVAVVAAGIGLATTAFVPATSATVAGAAVAADGSQAGSAVTLTKTVTRTLLDDGKSSVVESRKVTLRVDATKDLRGRQEIGVSWSGAHPTGGIISDQNSIDAQEEEYPFVLLECRGVDSTTVPAAERLSPETCWTQDWSERYQDTLNTDYPPYRLDRYADAADQKQVAGAPATLPAACDYLPAPPQPWVPFIAASGHVYLGGPAGCAGQAPESESVTNSPLPSNETFGVTGLDGTGSADFDVWTSAENGSLGCDHGVACALVAVPIMGISCDIGPATAASDATACDEGGEFKPGQVVDPEDLDHLTVSGSLWWSASNWRNRITVPLTFAIPADACNVVNNGSSLDVYGSELMILATEQWSPHFCLDPKLFKFIHVQTGEPEARNLVATGSATGAFVSDPPPDGYGRPVVNAPVAVTGFSISYVIDGANGLPYTHLRLTPLLLAKLLTESYPAQLPVKEEDNALKNNPLNITDDPEFQKLNPGITHGVAASDAASTLLTLSSQSDVMEALTTYINDNPAARAWLNGEPDKYGMVVNPAYQDIKLPIDRWPLLSKFEPLAYYKTDQNDCLFNTPQPYLPLVAAPLPTLEDIGEAMQFAEAQSTTKCSQIDGTTAGEKLVALGAQTVGYRFMIGVTPIADADRYKLRSAALQTDSSKNFIAPTDASLAAAAAMLKPDATTGTWPIPYQAMRSTKQGAAAYPGTMVVYDATPTSGLSSTVATDSADLLNFAATQGQTPGFGVGQLPPGYLPMTAANHLQQLANYTKAAATAVAAQAGALPSLTATPTPSPSTSATTSSPGSTPTSSSSTSPTAGTSIPSITPPVSVSQSPVPVSSPTIAPPSGTAEALGRTLGIGLAGGWAVLIVILIAGLGLIAGPATYFIGRRAGRW